MRMLIWSLQCLLSGQSTRVFTARNKILVFTTITDLQSVLILASSTPDTYFCQTSPSVSIFVGFHSFFVPNSLSRQIQFRDTMSEHAELVPSNESPPDANTNPPGHGLNIESTLIQLNTNMGTMTQLLTEVCSRLPTRDTDARHEGRSSSQSPPGTGSTRQRRRSVSVSSDESSEQELEPKRKSRREDDSLSVHATDDDVAQLLAESSIPAKVTDKSDDANEDELLKELVTSLQEEDTKGPKVQQQLADIATKRWGHKLNPEKMTSILGKHPQPENCEDMVIKRVNPEIWAPLNAAKRKADLRLANMQQALQKATFSIVTSCDKLLAVKSKIETKEMITESVDAIALVGHVVSEISSIRREQLRPSIKSEYQTICSNDVPQSSKLLFGDDLAKQIRDAKETSRIGKTVGAYTKQDRNKSHRRHNPYQSGRDDRGSKGGSRQPFLGKGYRSTGRKKPYKGQKNETETK